MQVQTFDRVESQYPYVAANFICKICRFSAFLTRRWVSNENHVFELFLFVIILHGVIEFVRSIVFSRAGGGQTKWVQF